MNEAKRCACSDVFWKMQESSFKMGGDCRNENNIEILAKQKQYCYSCFTKQHYIFKSDLLKQIFFSWWKHGLFIQTVTLFLQLFSFLLKYKLEYPIQFYEPVFYSFLQIHIVSNSSKPILK